MAAPIATDPSDISRLRVMQRSDPDAAIRAVAQEFETLLAQQMLQAMRNVSFGDDGSGAHAGTYRQMLDGQLARSLTQGRGLGLADQLVAQLRGAPAQAGAVAADKTDMATPVRSSRPALRAPQAAATVPSGPVAPRNAVAEGPLARARSFVEQVLPYARSAAERLGVPVRAVIAHAALESGWGAHAPGDNFFGIKADASWRGARAALPTQEFEGGRMHGRVEPFRRYEGAAQAFDDYAAFLQRNPRYREALQQTDGPRFLNAVARAGYATDPAYADKLSRVYHSPLLDAALATEREQML